MSWAARITVLAALFALAACRVPREPRPAPAPRPSSCCMPKEWKLPV